MNKNRDKTGFLMTVVDEIEAVALERSWRATARLTDALNQITRFTYDPANGNLLTITDPRTHTTTAPF